MARRIAIFFVSLGAVSLTSAFAPLYEYETVERAGSLGKARGQYQVRFLTILGLFVFSLTWQGVAGIYYRKRFK